MNELNQMLLEEWEKADLTNNFIFCRVMRDETLCKELIERLLNIKVDHIEYVNQEQIIDTDPDAKSVRLDAYIKGSDKVFDLEMQTTVNADLPKRTRYYQAMMDVKDFLEFVHTGKAESKFTERIKSLVNKIKKSKSWRAEYMTMAMHYMEHERAALQRGLEQGREEKAIETARTMLADGEPIDKIHKYTGLSTEEIKQL